jgi:hypothetical protein
MVGVHPVEAALWIALRASALSLASRTGGHHLGLADAAVAIGVGGHDTRGLARKELVERKGFSVRSSGHLIGALGHGGLNEGGHGQHQSGQQKGEKRMMISLMGSDIRHPGQMPVERIAKAVPSRARKIFCRACFGP